MATKTITLETDSYEKLVRARLDPRESFSQVVRRAMWLEAPATAGGILDSLEALASTEPAVFLDTYDLDAMDERSRPARRESEWEVENGESKPIPPKAMTAKGH